MGTNLTPWQRFVKVQQNLPNVGKNSRGNYGSYMSLEDLNPALLRVLNDNGFAWITMPGIEDDKRVLKYAIADAETGDFIIAGSMELVMAQDTPQAQGSALTYARRYALTAVTGLVADMDDDGQIATDAAEEKSIQDRMQTNPAALVEMGKMLEAKGITEKEDKAILFEALTAPKDWRKLNTSGITALKKAIMLATPDTLQTILEERK